MKSTLGFHALWMLALDCKATGARLCGPENWFICTVSCSSISRCKIGSAEAIGPILHTPDIASRCT